MEREREREKSLFFLGNSQYMTKFVMKNIVKL